MLGIGNLGDAAGSNSPTPSGDRVESEASVSKTSAKDKDGEGAGPGDLGGFLGGLGTLIGRLSELAEKGKELQGLKEFGTEGGPRGSTASRSGPISAREAGGTAA